MVVGAAPERPVELAVGLGDRMLVDAGMTMAHQPVMVEFPVLVAIGAEPLAAVVVKFIGEAHRDAIAAERPDLLDEPIVELARPFAGEQRLDRLAPLNELGAVPPKAIDAVGQCHLGRIAAVPSILREAHLLDRAFAGEGRQGGTGHFDSPGFKGRGRVTRLLSRTLWPQWRVGRTRKSPRSN